VAFNVSDKSVNAMLQRHFSAAQKQNVDSLEKLSSGQVFTRNDPRPSEKALSDGLEFKLRSLSAAKRNINDAVSLLQTGESGLQDITNMLVRMKEINVAGASTTIGDRDRRYLLIEYEAIHDEINRVAATTTFNGIPLLNGQSKDTPEALIFRVGDPQKADLKGASDADVNTIRFDGLKSVVATTEAMGIKSARRLLANSNEKEGISASDVADLLPARDSDAFSTIYDQALGTLSTNRAIFGALQSRLQHAMDYVDVYQENIAAAKSQIADTNYATEVSKMVQSRMLMSAASSLMAHGNITAQLTQGLLNSIS